MSLVTYMIVLTFAVLLLTLSGWWMFITLVYGLSAELTRQMTEAKKSDNFWIIGGTVLSPFVAALAYMILRTIR